MSRRHEPDWSYVKWVIIDKDRQLECVAYDDEQAYAISDSMLKYYDSIGKIPNNGIQVISINKYKRKYTDDTDFGLPISVDNEDRI